ncbi:MAG: alpha/beta hydrolase [Acholeplasmataceae bacterium]|nr:MAG: alpha/beta hydrolase [Acholeplasmataceae bacterium]
MFVKINDIEMYYEKRGTGTPVVMLHGNREDHTIFLPLARKLEAYYTLYLVDARNHGKTTKTGVYDYQQMTRDIHAFIMQLKLSKPVVFGFSDGGIVGLMLASRHPNLLSKLIVAGANLHPGGLDKKVLKTYKEQYKANLDPYVGMMLKQPRIRACALRCIPVPTLVIAGEHDVVKQTHTLKIHRLIRDSQCLIMPDRHHDDYVVNSDELAPVISNFLE